MQGRGMLVEIMIFYRNVNKYMEISGDPDSDLSIRDIFFLFFIANHGETTYYQLAGLMPYNSSYVSRTIKKLERMDLIIREKRGNKKIIKIGLRGRELLERNTEGRSTFLNTMIKRGLTLEELTTFFQTMEKFSKALEAEIGEDLPGDGYY